jgi:hypothetical protein
VARSLGKNKLLLALRLLRITPSFALKWKCGAKIPSPKGKTEQILKF